MPEIQLKNVRKVYKNGVYALDGIDLNIEQGEFVSIVGASGCGKTTLLKCIAGLESITAGELLIAGEVANATRVQDRKVGIVFQEYTLYPNMSVFENIAFPLRRQKLPYDEVVLKVKTIMEKLGISCISAQIPKEISYGQMQRTALARALIKNPDIILFDEPLSNIDEEKKREYRHLIVETKKLFPESTYIYVTHNLAEAFSMSDRILVMDKGKVVQCAPGLQLFEYPCNRVVLEALHQNVVYEDCVIKDGCIVTEDKKIELSPLQKASLGDVTEAKATCAFYDGYVTCLDENEDAFIGAVDKVSFPIQVDAKEILLCGRSYSLGPISEGLLKFGSGTVVMSQQHFRFTETSDCIELEGTVCFSDDKYLCCQVGEARVVLPCTERYPVGEKVSLYYPYIELEIYDIDGKRMLSKYAVTDNTIEVKVVSSQKGIVKIGKQKLKLNQTLPKKSVRLQFARTAFSLTKDKKQGIKIYVFNEDYDGKQTLVYAEIEDGQDYVVMTFEGRIECFGNGLNYVTVDTKQVKIEKGE